MAKDEIVNFNYGQNIKIQMDKRGFIQSASGLEQVFDNENINETIIGCHISELKSRVKKYETYHNIENGFYKTLNEKHKTRRKTK